MDGKHTISLANYATLTSLAAQKMLTLGGKGKLIDLKKEKL